MKQHLSTILNIILGACLVVLIYLSTTKRVEAKPKDRLIWNLIGKSPAPNGGIPCDVYWVQDYSVGGGFYATICYGSQTVSISGQ